MNNTTPNSPILPGVDCDVVNCEYNKDSKKCHAKHIKVGPQSAVTTGDTVCDTFKKDCGC